MNKLFQITVVLSFVVFLGFQQIIINGYSNINDALQQTNDDLLLHCPGNQTREAAPDLKDIYE